MRGVQREAGRGRGVGEVDIQRQRWVPGFGVLLRGWRCRDVQALRRACGLQERVLEERGGEGVLAQDWQDLDELFRVGERQALDFFAVLHLRDVQCEVVRPILLVSLIVAH